MEVVTMVHIKEMSRVMFW